MNGEILIGMIVVIAAMVLLTILVFIGRGIVERTHGKDADG